MYVMCSSIGSITRLNSPDRIQIRLLDALEKGEESGFHLKSPYNGLETKESFCKQSRRVASQGDDSGPLRLAADGHLPRRLCSTMSSRRGRERMEKRYSFDFATG